MKLFIEKSRFRVGAGERKRLWWRTEQTIYLYYQKIIRIRIDILCLRQAQAPGLVVNIRRWLSGAEITGSMSENVPSTGSGTESNTVIELVEITGRNKNLPSTSSGTESSSKYNTVIERSRNHRDENKNVPSIGSGIGSNTVIERSLNHREYEWECAFDKLRHRKQHVDWAESKSPGVVIINLSYKSLKSCYFFRKFRVSIK